MTESAPQGGRSFDPLRDLVAPYGETEGDWHVELLAGLIPLVPAELLTTVVTVSDDLPDASRGMVLEELVPRLAEAGTADQLWQAVRSGRAIRDEYHRSRTLSHVAAAVPPAVSAELAEAADELGQDFWRAKVLVNLPADGPSPARPVSLESWTAWARTVQDAQGELPPATAEPPRSERGGSPAGLADQHAHADVEYARVRALIAAALADASGRTTPDLEAAIRLARTLSNPLARTLALADIADLLGRRAVLVGEALASARSIADPSRRVLGLARVAPLLEQQHRFEVIGEAVASAHAVPDPSQRAAALVQVASSVSDHDRPSIAAAAATTAQSVSSPYLRSLRLAEVSRIVTGRLRLDLIGEAMDTAREIEPGQDRALPLAQIAPYLPDSQRPRALAEALAESSAVPDKGSRADVLSVLARNLTAEETVTTQRRQALTGRLRRRLGELSAGAGMALMSESVRNLAAPAAITIAAPDLTGRVQPGRDQPRPKAGHRRPAAKSARKNRPATSPRARRKPGAQGRVVSTGFSSVASPDMPVAKSMPLACQARYYFWLEIGQTVAGAIDLAPTRLPESVPSGARLQVVLFAYPDELTFRQDLAVGEMELRADGSAVVLRQPADDMATGSNRLRQRLFFPVQAPDRSCVARLRCNIYYQGVLIQSHLVRARIMRDPVATSRSLSTVTDYQLSRSLSPAHLATLRPHRLSLLLNSNGQGTHGLRVFGADGADTYRRDATLDVGLVNTQRKTARNALREVAWGNASAWNKRYAYRYEDGRRDLDRLSEDLVSLAVSGSRLLLALLEAVADDRGTTAYVERDALAPLLREPAFVQLALKESPNSVFPIELLYDYRLTPSSPNLGLCASFASAFLANVPMDQVPCFAGHCPQATPEADPALICPSGFWGYRHYLGVPFSLGGTADVPPAIEYDRSPQVAVGVFRDFKLVGDHWANLQTLKNGLRWEYADTRSGTMKNLRQTQPHLVYLYCHGGMSKSIPFVRVEDMAAYPITPDDLFQDSVSWTQSHPLVFVNGCETAGLQPEQAIAFVRFFVRTAGAAGMIGTQITIFEQLACDFAEACLRGFLVDERTIGEAVRSARLNLLGMGNPLGLVYIPFALASLHLSRRPESPLPGR